MATEPLEIEVEFLIHQASTVGRLIAAEEIQKLGLQIVTNDAPGGRLKTTVIYQGQPVLEGWIGDFKTFERGDWERSVEELYEQAIKSKVVQQSRDPNCKHLEVSYVTVPFDGQRFDCKGCGYAERMPYAPGKVIRFPPNSIIDGTHRVDENGVVKRVA